MNTKRMLLLFIIISFLVSCDYIFTAEIKNETNHPILLKMKFDTIELNKNWKNKEYLPFLISYPDFNNKKATDFDTINLIKTFTVHPKEIFILESHTSRPDFDLFENLTIITKDTMQLKNKQEIKTAFKQTDKRLWQLIVK